MKTLTIQKKTPSIVEILIYAGHYLSVDYAELITMIVIAKGRVGCASANITYLPFADFVTKQQSNSKKALETVMPNRA